MRLSRRGCTPLRFRSSHARLANLKRHHVFVTEPEWSFLGCIARLPRGHGRVTHSVKYCELCDMPPGAACGVAEGGLLEGM